MDEVDKAPNLKYFAYKAIKQAIAEQKAQKEKELNANEHDIRTSTFYSIGHFGEVEQKSYERLQEDDNP